MTDRELDAPKALTELQRRVLARLFADGGDAPADDVKVSTGMLTEETVRPLADAGYITFTTSRLGRTWLHLTPAGRALFDKLGVEAVKDAVKAYDVSGDAVLEGWADLCNHLIDALQAPDQAVRSVVAAKIEAERVRMGELCDKADADWRRLCELLGVEA
jgi:DNA-binding MarR family transcriptional regulator